jgi:2,4-dienoyl-CoA reductase-like NADH-dependent reductase (Old Yellow Enzyme family)
MSDNPHFPLLFSSLKVRQRTLRNRVVLSATLTNYGAGHRVTDRWTNFLVERAKGGCGAIVTEVIAVDPAALAHGGIVAGYDEENKEGFKRTAEAVEGAGACLIAQLWHPGRQQLWSPVWSHRRPPRRSGRDSPANRRIGRSAGSTTATGSARSDSRARHAAPRRRSRNDRAAPD